jgi:hypothetical protein
MRNSAQIKNPNPDPITDLHNRFIATMQNCIEHNPSIHQQMYLIGLLSTMQQKKHGAGLLAGESGSKKMGSTYKVIKRLILHNVTDKKAWPVLRIELLAIWKVLQADPEI